MARAILTIYRLLSSQLSSAFFPKGYMLKISSALSRGCVSLATLICAATIAGCGNSTASPTPAVSTNSTLTPKFVPFIPKERVYVSNKGAGTIIAFSLSDSGNVAPENTIGGSNTGLTAPFALAVDADGTIYTANDGSSTVLIFPNGANGNVTPRTLNVQGPTEGIAIDNNGSIYVSSNTLNSIAVYAAGSVGNASPVATISGNNTELSHPTGMAFDTNNNLYVGVINNGLAGLGEFSASAIAAGGIENIAPIATVTDANGTALSQGPAADSNGRIVTGNMCAFGSGIEIFAPGLTSNVAPVQTILSSTPGCTVSYAVDVTSIGFNAPTNNIYALTNAGKAASDFPYAISVFASTANGSVASTTTPISGSNTTFNNPMVIAIH